MQRLLLRHRFVGAPGGGSVMTQGAARLAVAVRAASSSPPSSSSTPTTSTSTTTTTTTTTPESHKAHPAAGDDNVNESNKNDTNNIVVTFGRSATVDAYNEFAKLVDCCDVDGLLKGAEQAYYSTSLVMDALLKPITDVTEQLGDESKEKIGKGVIDPLARLALTRWQLPIRGNEAVKNLEETFGGSGDDASSRSRIRAATVAPTATRSTLSSSSQKSAQANTTHAKSSETESAAGPASSSSSSSLPPHLDTAKAAAVDDEVEHRLVPTLERLLPISHLMAQKLFHMWDQHLAGKINAFLPFCRTDLVVATELVGFIRFDNALLHYNPLADSAQSVDITVSDSVVSYWKKHSILPQPAAADTNNASSSTATTATASSASASGMTRLAKAAQEAQAKDNEDTLAEGDIAVTIRVDNMTMNDVPASAKALVLVAMDVACPPQRFAKFYDYFYQRLIGCQNENQRMAVARLFALFTPIWAVKAIELLAKPFTPQLEIGYTSYVGSKLGLPEDMSQRLPTQRKLVCFYMDKTNRWVLSDLLNLDAVISKMPVMPEDA